MRAGVAQVVHVSAVLFSRYVNITTPSSLVDLAKYASDTAVMAASFSPSFIFAYPDAGLNRTELWLRYWRIAINVSVVTAVFFVKATVFILKPRTMQIYM
jgi:hypothetical protein